jgi:hypothetical protein
LPLEAQEHHPEPHPSLPGLEHRFPGSAGES